MTRSMWQDQYRTSGTSGSTTMWFSDTSWTNCSWGIIEDFEAAARRRAMLRRRCREAIANLVTWHARELEAWLIVAKRFDFRSAPRWSAHRWKSKT